MPFLLGPHGSMMLGEKEEDAEKFSSTSKPVLLMQADQCGLLHAPVRNPPDLRWSDAQSFPNASRSVAKTGSGQPC